MMQCPKMRDVSVADHEADIYDIFRDAPQSTGRLDISAVTEREASHRFCYECVFFETSNVIWCLR